MLCLVTCEKQKNKFLSGARIWLMEVAFKMSSCAVMLAVVLLTGFPNQATCVHDWSYCFKALVWPLLMLVSGFTEFRGFFFIFCGLRWIRTVDHERSSLKKSLTLYFIWIKHVRIWKNWFIIINGSKFWI